MRKKVAVLLLLNAVALAGVACSGVQRSQISEKSLRIALSINVLQGESTHPMARIELENISEQRIAFSRTFGITNGNWLELHIETSEGQRIYYPTESDLFEAPPYRCLSPGERVLWEIDLLDWKVEVGGELYGDKGLGFDLPPGGYRARASYSESGRTPRRCAAIDGVSRSDWVSFEVE